MVLPRIQLNFDGRCDPRTAVYGCGPQIVNYASKDARPVRLAPHNMPQPEVYLGIDFGTSNSSIAYVFGGDVRDLESRKIHVDVVPIPVDEDGAKAERMPSMVAKSLDRRSRKPVFGWQSLQQFYGKRRKIDYLKHGVSIFRSVKSDLGSSKVYPHSCDPELNTPEKVAAAIIGKLVQHAKDCLSGYNLRRARTVITVPASLSESGRKDTLRAAADAGLDPSLVELIDEPVAALLDWLNHGRSAAVLEVGEPKNVLIFDYGGGTLDLSLVRAQFDNGNSKTGLKVENLAISQYRRLGGDDVDRAIMAEAIWPQIEKHLGRLRATFSANERQKVEDTLIPTVARRLKERLCKAIKESKTGRRSSDATERLPVTFESIELPRDFVLTEVQFRQIMLPFLIEPTDDYEGALARPTSLLNPLIEVLERGGVEPHQLHAIILHGGSCKNPLVKELLSQSFGEHTARFYNTRIFETPNLDTSVARGAALAGYWRFERGVDIVQPIAAEEIGILTLDDQPVPLVKSGQALPFPSEDGVHEVSSDFFVPRANQEKLIVPFYTGAGAKRISEAIHLQLPENVKAGARVKIKLRVDRNKQLQWWYSVSGAKFIPATHLNDPWSKQLATAEMRELLEHRRKMRASLLDGGSLTEDQQDREVQLLRTAGLLDEAELRLQDLIEHRGESLLRCNQASLLAGSRGDRAEELKWAEKAVALNPRGAIVLGNLGCVLADLKRTEEAIAKIREALSINADLGYLYSKLGDIYRSTGKEDLAIREYGEALRLATARVTAGERGAWWSVAALQQKLGNYEEAARSRAKAQSQELADQLSGNERDRIAGPDSGVFTLEWDDDEK